MTAAPGWRKAPPITTWVPHGPDKVRSAREGSEPPTGDASVDHAHENAQVTANFLQRVLKRDSLDGAGGELNNFAHDESIPGNAYWDEAGMHYSDGDATTGLLSKGLDVAAHEMFHGVTSHSAGLEYSGQAGALNESVSDLFGVAVEQWHADPKGFRSAEGARRGNWQIGEAVMTPSVPGDAIRDMARPGTAYDNPDMGRDIQPGHMRDYLNLPEDVDFGGVHLNSGIPNRAAYEAAQLIGTEKVAKIWYDALTTKLGKDATFEEAAAATTSSARKLYGKGDIPHAVRNAWKAVGLLQNAGRSIPMTPPMTEDELYGMMG